MAMPLTVPRYTIRDLESFPDDGNRYELLDGLLLVTPAPGVPHQLALTRLVSVITAYLNRVGDATAFFPGVMEFEPKHHLEPDVLVVPNSAFPSQITLESKWSEIREWWLAVEISGAGSEVYDRDFKGPAYLALGVLEYWRLDLREGSLFVSRSGGPIERKHTETVTWLPPGRSEPLVLVVPDLFR